MKALQIIFIGLLWTYLPKKMSGQKNKVDSACSCARLIEVISEKWKADSLAGNGYRMSVYSKLLNCSMKSVSSEYLLKALGPPTKIRKISDGRLDLIYRYYDYKYIDTSASKWRGYGWSTIVFVTGKSGQEIEEVFTGSGEY